MTGPRDWDKELAAIDRAIERAPAGPAASPAAVPTAGGARPTAVRGAAGRAWMRVALAGALAVSLPFWPYQRACGAGLLLYLGALAMLILGGIWAAASAWRHRRPAAHVVALAALAWGCGLAAREILPRAGYARVTASWSCG
jgi:hypothetical protein